MQADLPIKKIKVLIVDDSALTRDIIAEELSTDAELEIVGKAENPYVARDMIVQYAPDVLILDIEMPRMDGLSFLEKLRQYHPMPVVIFSALTPANSEVALRAFELGAVEVMHKPKIDLSYKLQEMRIVLSDKVKAAAQAKDKCMKGPPLSSRKAPQEPEQIPALKSTDKIVAIGASTGGVEAIRTILTALPESFPGILITQHMPEKFTTTFAEDLNKRCRIEVREAREGDTVHPGLALVAPGNYHLILQRDGGRYYAGVRQGPLVCRQRPSTDVLFDSVSKCAGKNAMGVILTGMGNDGANGLLKMRQAGAFTIAQDEASCIVFGMPKEAIKRNAAMKVLPLEDIPRELIEQCSKT